MSNKVETKPSVDRPLSSGEAFQLTAAVLQTISGLKLTEAEAKQVIDNRRMRERVLRQFRGEAPPEILSPALHCSIEETGVTRDHDYYFSVSHLETSGLKDYIEFGSEFGREKLLELNIAWRGKNPGNVFRCNVHRAPETLTTIFREVLNYDGPDSRLLSMLEKRRVFWSIFQILELLQAEIDNAHDPLGIEEFGMPAHVWFPVVVRPTVVEYAIIKQNFEGGLIQIGWREFRRTKKWYVDFMHMSSAMETESGWFAPPNGTIFFLNDPRRENPIRD